MEDKKDIVLLHQSVKDVEEHLRHRNIRKKVWNDFIKKVEEGMLPHNYYNKEYGFINWLTIQRFMEIYLDEWDVDELLCAIAKARDDFTNIALMAAKGKYSRVNVSIYNKLFELYYPKKEKDELDTQQGISKLQETRDKLNEAVRGENKKKAVDRNQKEKVSAFLNTYKSYYAT